MDTRIAQALLLAGGFAGGAILARRGVNAKYFRGHSAAGVTAAGLTGAITLRTAARIMKERGDLMHQASIDTPGTVLITDLDDEETLDAICKETGVYPANYNSPHQILLSGLAGAIKVARTRIKAEGARATLFRGWAAGAVHSPIIEVTANMWRSFLDPIVVEDIDAEVVRNIDAKTTSDGDEIKDDLGGMDMPVKWRQGTVTLLGKGVNRFVEIGPRKRPDREHVLRSFLMDQGLEGRVVMEHISDILGLNRQE
jgi:[acyl-carrier-protein] S-malonyltransferase